MSGIGAASGITGVLQSSGLVGVLKEQQKLLRGILETQGLLLHRKEALEAGLMELEARVDRIDWILGTAQLMNLAGCGSFTPVCLTHLVWNSTYNIIMKNRTMSNWLNQSRTYKELILQQLAESGALFQSLEVQLKNLGESNWLTTIWNKFKDLWRSRGVLALIVLLLLLFGPCLFQCVQNMLYKFVSYSLISEQDQILPALSVADQIMTADILGEADV